MKPKQQKKQLDLFSLFYGIGAAILITGILFKHLSIPFADLMFVIGLGMEVIIFLISSISFKQQDNEYHWEKVFPQLKQSEGKKDSKNGTKSDDDSAEIMSIMKENLQAQRKLYSDISYSLTDMKKSLDTLSTELNKVVPHVNSSIGEVKKQLDDSRSAAKNLNTKLQKINTLFDQKAN